MRRPGKNDAGRADGHNQTTEPFNFGVSPYAPTVTGNKLPPETPPATLTRPVPQQQVPSQAPVIGAYPFLPPPPVQRNGRDDHSARNIASSQPGDTASSTGGRKLQRLFPSLVGLCFVVVQMLLLVSFALKIVGQWNSTFWANALYGISDIFMWPIQTLVHQLPLPFSISTEILTLLTILLYGVVARIVVRCLKLLLHTR